MKSPFRILFLIAIVVGPLWAQTTTLNVSADLVRLGIAASNMTPNQAALDSGPLLESALRYAARNNFNRIVADAGSYYFLSASPSSPVAHVLLSGVTTPLTVDFQGADLNFSKPDKIGFFLANLANVTLQNCTMDYSQQRYTQLTVTGVNAPQRQIQFTVQSGWQTPTALSALNPVLAPPAGVPETNVYVFRNGQPWVGFTQMRVQPPYTDSVMTLATSVPTATVAAIRAGDVAVLNLRAGGTALLASGLTGCTLRNIKIYSGTVGLRTIAGSSNLFERIEVMPKPGTDRLISTLADGISPSQPGANNTLRLCRAIRTCDDGFSPNTYVFGSVQGVLSARSVQVQGDGSTALAANSPLPNGSNVVFQRASDGAIVASAQVVSQATAAAIGGLTQVVLTVDRDLPAGVAGTYVYSTDANWRGGGLLLERNTVQQQGWARGMSLWGLMNTTLYGNYIRRSSFAGVAIMHQLPPSTDWIVPPVVNLALVNNVIDGTITGPDIHSTIQLAAIQSIAFTSAGTLMAASPHRNISLTANFIADPARSAIWFGNTSGGSADVNTLFNPNNDPNLTLAYAPYRNQQLLPLVVEASENIALGANVVDQASRRMFVTDSGYRELAAYTPGATIRLSALALGSVATPVVSLTDADGRSWPLTLAATSTHAVDLALPSGVGLGGAVISLKAGALSYLGTLFIDSQDNLPTINQATFLVSTASTKAPADATTLSFLVVTQPGNAYAITTTDAFVTPGAGGSSAGVVTVNLAKNLGTARTATVEIAGQPITLTQAGATDPVIVNQPQSLGVAAGGPAVFNVTATGALTYQWFLNGVAVAGATNASLALTGVTPALMGTYTVAARNAAGSVTSSGALLALTELPSVSRLSNLSILTNITTSDPLFTLGTVIGGPGTAGSKALLIRAAGPALAALGVGGTLPDPKLEVFSGQTITAANDNWGGTSALSGAFAAVGAFAYASAASKDAAVFNPALVAGNYTVQVTGVGGATGTVIAEIYDSTPPSQFTSLTPRLINVSVLKNINPGEILTAGFVIAGPTPKRVLIRAVGPTLGAAPFNIGGAMADPKLELFTGQTVTASNDNWGTPVGAGASSVAQLSAAFGQVGAFNLTAGSKDAVLLATLAPGNYTAQVSDVNGASGLAIVEVYEVP